MKNILLFFAFGCLWNSTSAQNSLDSFLGGWAGLFEKPEAFDFLLELEYEQDQYFLKVIGQQNTTVLKLNPWNKIWKSSSNTGLEASLAFSDEQPILFIFCGHHLSYIPLSQQSTNLWTGAWSLLLHTNESSVFYLSLDQYQDGTRGASTFFQAPTFHYMYGQDFSDSLNYFQFQDLRSNLVFNGIAYEEMIELSISFLGEETQLELFRQDYESWEIGSYHGQEPHLPLIEHSALDTLVFDILRDTLPNVHSIIISESGKIIFEQYFDGFGPHIPHDTRSLSKSVAGALTGLAIDQGLLRNESDLITDYLQEAYPLVDWSQGKDRITLHHLLTMSSGLDVIDYGLDRISFANEGAYQSRSDWIEHILSAPMVFVPGKHAYYGSGSPTLLAPIIQLQIDEPLHFYIHRHLLGPLNLKHYRIQTDNLGNPYFGGGWYFSPRQLIKFGELYLNRNESDSFILSDDWIKKSKLRHTILENAHDKNPYGYLFYHKDYEVDNTIISSVEGRGTGGQYLFVIPEFNVVTVITSGNYRNNRGFQPERIMRDYILPVIKQ